ncbi:hypothetical protein BDZ94DRAFT_1307370 [Collybia nuda]|uniref:Uncharacterized protein n=1 Tax=Collybia nuda TaxID=64659 RepID=A0A9P5YCN2_9AGAR|nr:hypothetical protein BDZ94DRAFT_1307370 [Collybia nuda]
MERLESSLKNTQDQADELEFQLLKLKQARKLSTGVLQQLATADATKDTQMLEKSELLVYMPNKKSALENLVFDVDALLMQVAVLEEQLVHSHTTPACYHNLELGV